MIIHNIWENKKCSKPLTSISTYHEFHMAHLQLAPCRPPGCPPPSAPTPPHRSAPGAAAAADPPRSRRQRPGSASGRRPPAALRRKTTGSWWIMGQLWGIFWGFWWSLYGFLGCGSWFSWIFGGWMAWIMMNLCQKQYVCVCFSSENHRIIQAKSC